MSVAIRSNVGLGPTTSGLQILLSERGAERQLGVRPPLVIAELDLERSVIEPLDHGAHLTANEPTLGPVHEQSDHVENLMGAGAGTGGTSEEIAAGQSWEVFPGPHNPRRPNDAGPLRPGDH
jgi:hypothetical protein